LLKLKTFRRFLEGALACKLTPIKALVLTYLKNGRADGAKFVGGGRRLNVGGTALV